MKPTYKLLILILCLPFVIEAQVSDSLKIIGDHMSVENNTTCHNCDVFSRSRKYDIRLNMDTLVINIVAVDSHRMSKDPRDRHESVDEYKMNVNDIEQIAYVSLSKELYDLEWIESYVEFTALRNYPLFKLRYKGAIQETDMVKLRVIDQNDTIHFKRLTQYLNEQLNLDSNYQPPSCKIEKVTIPDGDQPTIDLIEFNNLEEAISLNENTNLSEEMDRILMDYLRQENIPKLYGDIIVSRNNEMMYFESYQNDMHNYLTSLDSIPLSYQVLEETGYLKITNLQMKQVTELLKKQEWKAGTCNQKSVNCRFDFYVENKDYERDNEK